ncbi:thymus-specific serine protease [Elysia marginata]|uniref:Thymus-specific serine protease n=1 Tax=Elysia marginata TaxID=1093978 RepID=A0AAV4I5J5_9GAST|nr:thymus-specific serine protease [Elysia marginata]
MNADQLWQLLFDPPNAQWFEQRLDHFNSTDSRTWKQKYFQAGPASSQTLFVLIGGESSISEGWMVSGQWTEYAKEQNAARLQLEHWFYGDSHPTRDLSVDSFQYLSSEQALADLANFITAMKKQFEASKVIVLGGSYSGALAAWFRLKYPYLVDAAVASSAPVLAQVDFKDYLEVVAQSLNTFKPVNACDNAISVANAALKEKLKTPKGRKDLKKKFE